ADTPVVLAGIIRVIAKDSIEVVSPEYPGRAQMTDRERATVDDFLKKTELARDPLRAAREGKATQEILQQELSSLREQQTMRRLDRRTASNSTEIDGALQRRINEIARALSAAGGKP